VRTPNAACVICTKPLYRRPSELARVRYAACIAHRAQAQSFVGVTEAQQAGLKLGRQKGTNYRPLGHRQTDSQKIKVSEKNRAFWAANPEKALARGEKTRGDKNVRWKGGATRLNTSIRQMTENRRWMDAVKNRDGRCLRCGSTDNLEAHHKVELHDLVERHGIRSRDEARACPELWSLGNGETLCQSCHYTEHGRDGRIVQRGRNPKACPGCGILFLKRGAVYCGPKCRDAGKASRRGAANPNWRGGRIAKSCLRCGTTIWLKPAVVASGGGKFCSMRCRYAAH
jgi:hypothetical protein